MHVTLVLLASAFLVCLCIQEREAGLAGPPSSPGPPLIELSTSEIHHLLARLLFPAPASVPLVDRWSWFRRTHQYWAGYYHRRRRAKAG